MADFIMSFDLIKWGDDADVEHFEIPVKKGGAHEARKFILKLATFRKRNIANVHIRRA